MARLSRGFGSSHRHLADGRGGKGVGEQPNHTTARRPGPLRIRQYSLFFTMFSPRCSPSRAALLTGLYPHRLANIYIFIYRLFISYLEEKICIRKYWRVFASIGITSLQVWLLSKGWGCREGILDPLDLQVRRNRINSRTHWQMKKWTNE